MPHDTSGLAPTIESDQPAQASTPSDPETDENVPLLQDDGDSNPLLHDVDANVPSDDDDEASKRVLSKIDRTIIPLLFVTYMLNFMDKAILSSAAVFGLREDNHLHDQQYSWVGSIFYVAYLLWDYPTTLLIPRLPTARYLAANTLLWGIAVGSTAACTSFAGLLTARFFLGVAEATITPAAMFITATWYTRDEMPARIGIWFAGNSAGGLCSSVLAFAVGRLLAGDEHDGGGVGVLRPWRWMYIILGAFTLLWALPLYLFLPDSIPSARFLDEKERRVATRRVALEGTGSTTNTTWSRHQFIECLVDPKTWLILAIELLTQIPNGGTHSFANIVLTSFGFTDLQSTLINIPYSLLSAAVIFGTGRLAGAGRGARHRNLNCLLIAAVLLPCITGSALIYQRARLPHGAVQLLAYFLLASGPAAMPLNMSLVQSNYRGVTKRMTVTALMFAAYCCGNIVGPHLFRASEAPAYDTAFRAIAVCYTLVVVLALALRVYLQKVNARRDRDEGPLDASKVVQDDDTTDWATAGFRYRS